MAVQRLVPPLLLLLLVPVDFTQSAEEAAQPACPQKCGSDERCVPGEHCSQPPCPPRCQPKFSPIKNASSKATRPGQCPVDEPHMRESCAGVGDACSRDSDCAGGSDKCCQLGCARQCVPPCLKPCPQGQECVFNSGNPCGGSDCSKSLREMSTCKNVSRDPCARIDCMEGKKCVNQGGRGVCVEQVTCATLLCGAGTHCVETSGKARCVPDSTCKNLVCTRGQECVVIDKQARCQTPTKCTDRSCPPDWKCIETRGNITCVQGKTCANVRCVSGTVCTMRNGQPVCDRSAGKQKRVCPKNDITTRCRHHRDWCRSDDDCSSERRCCLRGCGRKCLPTCPEQCGREIANAECVFRRDRRTCRTSRCHVRLLAVCRPMKTSKQMSFTTAAPNVSSTTPKPGQKTTTVQPATTTEPSTPKPEQKTTTVQPATTTESPTPKPEQKTTTVRPATTTEPTTPPPTPAPTDRPATAGICPRNDRLSACLGEPCFEDSQCPAVNKCCKRSCGLRCTPVCAPSCSGAGSVCVLETPLCFAPPCHARAVCKKADCSSASCGLDETCVIKQGMPRCVSLTAHDCEKIHCPFGSKCEVGLGNVAHCVGSKLGQLGLPEVPGDAFKLKL